MQWNVLWSDEFFLEQLTELERDCRRNFARWERDDAAETDAEYQRIRVAVLELFARSQKWLEHNEFLVFKQKIMAFLCQNCGCHLDMEVLEAYTPHVLADEELDYIVQNSALHHWY